MSRDANGEHDQQLRERVRAALRLGFGAEDIAVRLSQHPDAIRRIVREMRQDGEFRRPGFFAPLCGDQRRD